MAYQLMESHSQASQTSKKSRPRLKGRIRRGAAEIRRHGTGCERQEGKRTGLDKQTAIGEWMMDPLRSYRVFQGIEIQQVVVNERGIFPADAEDWYWEPSEYEGEILYSRGYASREEAIYAAESSQL
jgi:hypothetical protein